MNLKIAIESGRLYRRPSFPPYRWYSYEGCDLTHMTIRHADGNLIGRYQPDKEDICAEDWEIDEERIEITRSQAFELYKMGIFHTGSARVILNPLTNPDFEKQAKELKEMLSELGFSE